MHAQQVPRGSTSRTQLPQKRDARDEIKDSRVLCQAKWTIWSRWASPALAWECCRGPGAASGVRVPSYPRTGASTCPPAQKGPGHVLCWTAAEPAGPPLGFSPGGPRSGQGWLRFRPRLGDRGAEGSLGTRDFQRSTWKNLRQASHPVPATAPPLPYHPIKALEP